LERRRPGGRRGGVLAAFHERRRDAGAPAGEDAGAPSLAWQRRQTQGHLGL